MRILLPALVATLLVPLAGAHGAPAILDNESQIISDDASDLSYAMDGYDLTSTYIRNAYWAPLDAQGVIVRVLASGATGQADAAHVDFTTGGIVVRLTTTDDAEWTSEAHIIEALSEGDGELPAFNANLQFFLSYEELGIEEGGALEGFMVRSYADDTLVDSSQGGMYVAGQEVPSMDANAIMESYETAAPDTYTETNVTEEGIEVKSLITTAGQHVSVILGDAPGWDVALEGAPTASISSGGTLKLPLLVSSMGSGSLPITVETDLGGREFGFLVPAGDAVAWSEAPVAASEEEPVDQESPGPGALLLVALLALARRFKA